LKDIPRDTSRQAEHVYFAQSSQNGNGRVAAELPERNGRQIIDALTRCQTEYLFAKYFPDVSPAEIDGLSTEAMKRRLVLECEKRQSPPSDYSQGTPPPKARDSRTRQDVKNEFMAVFPSVPEVQVDKLSTGEMQYRIDCKRATPHPAGVGRQSAAEPPKNGKSRPQAGTCDAPVRKIGRFEPANMFFARGTQGANLKPSESLVWLRMWLAERNGFVAISYSQLARDCNLGLYTVTRAIAALRKANLVKIVKQGDINGHVNRYVLSPYPSEGTLADRTLVYAQIEHSPMLKSAETYAQNEQHPEGKEEEAHASSSSFQKRRSGPAVDARSGNARRPVLPPGQRNSDGGTHPLSPPPVTSQATTGNGQAAT
jgi:hypothetical protein